MRLSWLASISIFSSVHGFTPLSTNKLLVTFHAASKGPDNGRYFMEESSESGDKIQKQSVSLAQKTLNRNDFQKEITEDASNALASVGWSAPMMQTELSSDDPFVRKIDAQIFAENGVGLDGLLNPAKVVNLERDLYNLRLELAQLTGKAILEGNEITTEACDGGGGGPEADAIRKKIDKKERDLFIERRAVFRGWLKNVFLGQAVLSFALSWIMVTDPSILFGQYDWFSSVNSIDVSIKVLGFWWWWLFIVPSLRSRRPSGAEKKALDVAFLGTPLISIIAPALTKDTVMIWSANFALVAGAYAFAFLTYDNDDKSYDDDDETNGPSWLNFVYKSLDFGSGRERGARK